MCTFYTDNRNTSKTKMTVFHTSQRIVQYPSITINDTNVEVVDDFKFLDIMLNKHLKWTAHTDMIANIISKYIGVLNRLKHTLLSRILITLYNTLLLPRIYYGLSLWGIIIADCINFKREHFVV